MPPRTGGQGFHLLHDLLDRLRLLVDGQSNLTGNRLIEECSFACTSSKTVQSVRMSRRLTETSSGNIGQYPFSRNLDSGLVLVHRVEKCQLVGVQWWREV